jgi:N-acetylglutamate synthase-like GNAT family acetyltransferase
MRVEVRLIGHGTPEYDEVLALRLRILRTPLGLDFTPEQIAAEAADLHVAAYRSGKLVGCLLLSPQPGRMLLMRQVAVEPEVQGHGIGSAMVAFSEHLAIERGFSRIELHARETAVPFYLKLGYEVCSEPYIEVTLPHRTMRRACSAPTEAP